VLHSNFSRSHSHLLPDAQRNRIHVQQADSCAIFSAFGINADGGQEPQLMMINQELSHTDSRSIFYMPHFIRTLRDNRIVESTAVRIREVSTVLKPILCHI